MPGHRLLQPEDDGKRIQHPQKHIGNGHGSRSVRPLTAYTLLVRCGTTCDAGGGSGGKGALVSKEVTPTVSTIFNPWLIRIRSDKVRCNQERIYLVPRNARV